jgi:hypothetical protein
VVLADLSLILVPEGMELLPKLIDGNGETGNLSMFIEKSQLFAEHHINRFYNVSVFLWANGILRTHCKIIEF